MLPNSIVREVDHRALIKKRHEKQVKIAQEKGRSSTDVFMKDDKVTVQDHRSGKWVHKGVISGSRMSDDGSVQSYTIEMSDGSGELLRNKRYIKHDVWPVTRKSVRFTLDNTEADEVIATADQAPLPTGPA